MITVDKDGGFYGESVMQGLCGNYDDDISNDFRDPSGVHVAFSPSFAASWHYSEVIKEELPGLAIISWQSVITVENLDKGMIA